MKGIDALKVSIDRIGEILLLSILFYFALIVSIAGHMLTLVS